MAPDRPLTLADGSVIHSDAEILGGIPVFVGTRVPAQTLVDYLEGGYSVDEFLDNFPCVRREQVNAFLERATHTRKPASRNSSASFRTRGLSFELWLRKTS